MFTSFGPSLRVWIIWRSAYEVLHISHSRFFQMYEFTNSVSFMCFFPSSHSLRQVSWMYFIDPVQLQGLMRQFSGSSSERHIRQIYWSFENPLLEVYFINFWLLDQSSYSFNFCNSSCSLDRYSKPAIASPRPKRRESNYWDSLTSMVSLANTPLCIISLSKLIESRLLYDCFRSLSLMSDGSTTIFLTLKRTLPNLMTSPSCTRIVFDLFWFAWVSNLTIRHTLSAWFLKESSSRDLEWKTQYCPRL